MKEKLAIIRNLIEEITSQIEKGDLAEALNDELDSLEVLADHIDNCDDFDLESWTEELRHIVEEMNDN